MTPDTTTAITNVRLLDGDSLSDELTVVLNGSLIASVSSEPVDVADAIDGRGHVLLPGLIDSHLHVDGRASLEACANWGLTTVVDLAVRDIRSLDPLRHAEDLPTVLTAGVPASAPGGQHVKKMGFPPSSALTDAAAAHSFVAEQVAAGADLIKVIVEDPKVPGTKALPVAVIAAVVTAAHDAGKLVVAHAVTTASITTAHDAGVDVITHAPLNADLAPDLIATLASHQVVLIPTLTMMRGAVATLTKSKMLKALSTLGIAPKLDYAHAEASVALAQSAGSPVLAGTDANTEPLVPARPPYGESSTTNWNCSSLPGSAPPKPCDPPRPRRHEVFGLTDRGSVTPGLRADLVLIEGDPTQDITATRNIRATWIGGTQHGSSG